MPKLKVSRFQQEPSCCAVSACALMGNYWDVDIDYKYTKVTTLKYISKKVDEEGLDSGQMCRLLNRLGFRKVTLFTSDLRMVDFSWRHYKRKKIIEMMKELLKKKKDTDYNSDIRSVVKWLSDFNYNNQLVITYDFGRHIRESISKNRPVMLSFNWTKFFKYCKVNDGSLDPYNVEEEVHAVAAYGYDKRGVNICDSHHEYYKYKLKKYRKGFYKISWENLMTVIGPGDVYAADDYIG